jgi:flagellar biosynthesis protein FlhF
MKIKKFKAKTFSEALEMVKKELSADAVILSSEEKRGLRPYVEVTAAVDYEMTVEEKDRRGTGEDSGTGVIKERSIPSPDNKESATIHLTEGISSDIKREIEKIKEALEEMRFSGFEITLPQRKKKVFNILREKGVKEEFALRLSDKTTAPEELRKVIKDDLAKGISLRDMGEKAARGAIMLLGPTGVGKTTTVAKLAARAVRQGRRAAIINLDTYRIGAIEQIRIYARLLGIPLYLASNAKELKEGLRRFSKEREIVFIDTTGRNPRDEGHIGDIISICSEVWADGEIAEAFPLELHLLMNTNCDSDFLIESYRYYRRLPLSYIAFTKIDEATRLGNIYNMMMTYQRPVAYITTGQKVPDDIEFPEIEDIASLILKGYIKES